MAKKRTTRNQKALLTVPKLPRGYHLGKIDCYYALLKGKYLEPTGLLTNAESEEQAITVFNEHISVLAGKVLNGFVLIREKI